MGTKGALRGTITVLGGDFYCADAVKGALPCWAKSCTLLLGLYHHPGHPLALFVGGRLGGGCRMVMLKGGMIRNLSRG